MAVKDSDQIATDSNYSLGDYCFRIERSSVPGSSNDKIEAICTDKDGKNARKSIQVPSSTQIDGWYVEANETEASVYAIIKENPAPTGGVPYPFPYSRGVGVVSSTTGRAVTTVTAPYVAIRQTDAKNCIFLFASDESSSGHIHETLEPGGTNDYDIAISSTATYNGKTVYYITTNPGTTGYFSKKIGSMNPSDIGGSSPNWGGIAWMMVYGDSLDNVDKLVARFAIDLDDAGGDGPGSDWIDPGDYDPDWEEGDPTHTLYVEVTGALSGRHNDPIVDPSYSYIPSDKDTVKDYGCGGDGGHGGGGGAGASTVVVHKFATNQANSKEVTAIARRHGYGSGGGKGGKGGDGCILVYY